MAPSAAPAAPLASALPSVAEVRAGAGARAAAGRWRRLTESRGVRDALQALVRASAFGAFRQELSWVHGMGTGGAREERPQEDERARLLRPLWKYKVSGDGVVQCLAFSEVRWGV
ncbi:hypothetical protein H632_c5087p0 [Helicosporidium sp. ATCC 50920]|nr:hypothetical protein H632_c5087p0 [Helicosporidium sp. ATCC 50920]|eukprot:KDD71412.1 hypothetical protein H632_c5087p0 [Helicosporidium sp. ATCC 50920]